MKWTRPSIIVLLAIFYFALVESYGILEGAALVFILWSLYFVYKAWGRNI